jgi:predicted DNA-binding transcriptional regulator AlpA
MVQRGATPSPDERQQAPQLIGRAQTQQLFGVSRATLWRIVKSGALPAVYVDGRPRFLMSDIEALIRSRRTRRGS